MDATCRLNVASIPARTTVLFGVIGGSSATMSVARRTAYGPSPNPAAQYVYIEPFTSTDAVCGPSEPHPVETTAITSALTHPSPLRSAVTRPL